MEKVKFVKLFTIFLASLYGLFYMFDANTKSNTKRTDPKYKKDIKRIALWTSYFKDWDWKEIKGDKDNFVLNCSYPCSVHTTRTDPLLYDALVFHGRDEQLRPVHRKPSQVYIIYMLESPIHRESYFIEGDNFYNWTATYSHESDIWVPYWDFRSKRYNGSFKEVLGILPQMVYNRRQSEAMVAWVVSSCQTPSRREQYVQALQRHIKVDIYGGCGYPCSPNAPTTRSACHRTLASSGRYKFYLSFENSACRDYITEKAELPLLTGLVPVVYGGLEGSDHSFKFPPHSFIDVRNFSSPEQLAKYLLYLDKNDNAYLAYHYWRMHYELTAHNLLCNICESLHDSSMTSSRNVNFGEFWSVQNNCDLHSFDKVNSRPATPQKVL